MAGDFPATRGGAARAAGHRAIHGSRHRGDRVRPTGGAGRRQCRAGDGAAVRDSASRCPPPRASIRRLAQTFACGCALGRLRAGADGCRRHHLHAQARPSCLMCPIAGDCAAHAQGDGGPSAGTPRERRSGRCAPASPSWRCARTVPCCCAAGPRPGCSAACWRCRPPSGGTCTRRPSRRCAARRCKGEWWPVAGTVVHVFTHFRLEIEVYRALVPVNATPDLVVRSGPLPLGSPAASCTAPRCRP